MSFNPLFELLNEFLMFASILFSAMAKSISLYSSLTFVIAVYSLGVQNHTAIASSVAIKVAIMYGCFFKSNVKLEAYTLLYINEFLAVPPCQHTAAEHETKKHPDGKRDNLRTATMLDRDSCTLNNREGRSALLQFCLS